MQRGSTVYARHMPVDFDNQPLRLSRCTAGVVVIGSEGEVSVSVHRRHGHEKCIDVNLLREKTDRLTERIRYVVDDLTIAVFLSLLDQVTLGLLYEHAIGLY